jgi:transcriptional regulator with PAS, ATPase and Fis domain
MAKIAILLPNSDLVESAVAAAAENHLDLSTVSTLSNRALKPLLSALIDKNNPAIIIARGGQAKTIRQLTTLPVVEIKITPYEVFLMLNKAKQLTQAENPLIYVTGPDNMFDRVSISSLQNILGIRLRFALFDRPEEMIRTAEEVCAQGPDVVIGGKTVTAYCHEHGVPALRTFSGPESMHEACRTASILSDALDSEKKHAASLSMFIDEISSGVIQIDESGSILRANQFVIHLFHTSEDRMLGNSIAGYIPDITQDLIERIYARKKGIHGLNIRINEGEFFINLNPVIVDDTVSSVIINFFEGISNLSTTMERNQSELLRRGYIAKSTFNTMVSRSQSMQEVIRKAKLYSAYLLPVLLIGEHGTEKQRLAECIHNAGPYKKYPFIRINCGGYNPDDLNRILDAGFENLEDFRLLHNTPCTIYLDEVSALSGYAQQRLYALINASRTVLDPSGLSIGSNQIRFILTNSTELAPLVAKELFRPETYYAISKLTLHLPPLRERNTDIMGFVDSSLSELEKRYGRYVKLTQDAQDFLAHYDWPGNLLEIDSVISRAYVNSESYYLNAADIEACIDHSADVSSVTSSTPDRKLRSEKEEKLIAALHKYHGSRKLAAAELGISVSTLWRQMKAYRIPKTEGK